MRRRGRRRGRRSARRRHLHRARRRGACPARATRAGDARRIMVAKGIRHLPVVGSNAEVLGMLSLRDLMADEIDVLEHQVEGLVAFESANGIGG
ncbi:MAG TPA: CBS domain-containing protein [Polyangiaceae bacterium]